MSTIKYSIGAAVLSALLTCGVLYHFHTRKMGELGWLRENTGKLRHEAYQRSLGKQASPDSAVALPTPLQTVSPQPQANGEPAPQNPRGFCNQGLATPRAAVQTIAWGCEQADTDALAGMIWISQEDRAKLDAFLAEQPSEVRARWKSVDDMAAHFLVVSRMASPFPVADVLEAVPITQAADGQATLCAVHPMHLRRDGSAWKCVMTEATLRKLASEIASTAQISN